MIALRSFFLRQVLCWLALKREIASVQQYLSLKQVRQFPNNKHIFLHSWNKSSKPYFFSCSHHLFCLYPDRKPHTRAKSVRGCNSSGTLESAASLKEHIDQKQPQPKPLLFK